MATHVAHPNEHAYAPAHAKLAPRRDVQADAPAHDAGALTKQSPDDALGAAREVVRAAALALHQLAERLDASLLRARDLLFSCRGQVIVVGVGKSGLIGQKLSATLASTGTPSFFLHAGEAAHGDLGRVRAGDVVVALSNSGESLEVLSMLPQLRSLHIPIVAMTSRLNSSLGRSAEVGLLLGEQPEACPMGLVPTTSTTAMLALCDALAMAVMALRPDPQATYARLHPGGALGQKLRRVDEVMRCGDALPLASIEADLRAVLRVMGETPGRPGAAMLVDPAGRLAGLFTDGDLRRLIEEGGVALERPIAEVMRHGPKTVRPEQRVSEAVALLHAHHVDQVPVIDGSGRPIGLLDVQDVLPTGP